ncbi:hypothetical protein [Marilutibacter chinensis]|uniref:Transmembrane protein n=1 Tax=Marilutibacter chinensis TaxID=2912247 RepID=A0ABS9HRE5_9GAMM|nr:hypothetical protein [Lysobacter chinensis]MCF7221081.1 hypothetical protein [Lysobacter chinensis]
MDLLYSASLLLAIVLAGTGLAAAATCLLMRAAAKRSTGYPPSPTVPARHRAWLRGSAALVVTATACLCVSVLAHRFSGHGPGSPAPMDMPRFLIEHPAFGIAALLVLSAATALAFARNKA